MSKALVLYHGNCPDGFGSAWAAWLALGNDAEYRPVQYGEAPPDVMGRAVYVLDFSYPRATLLAMKESAASLLVLDHHKTAQTDLAGLDFCEFDMERSGATMTWDRLVSFGPENRRYFNEPEIVRLNAITREFVEYLTDRDLWRFALDRSREVSAAVWSYPRTFEIWTQLAQRIEFLKEEGVAILRYQRALVEQMCANAEVREIGGHRVPVVNATVCFSEVGEALCIKYPDAPFAAYYFDRPGVRQWGARSRGGFDVSEVAKALGGGGGHKAAAGWTEIR
jgi:oligoribonuclease NrnB/cAMP/cGMP phosphodiesterase (DHH superfamily)